MFPLFIVIVVIVFYCNESKGQMDRSVSPALKCASCKATVAEIWKSLKKDRSESNVMAVMDGFCEMDKFRVYDFIPPKMVMGCEAIMEYDENLEKLFMDVELTSSDAIEQKFCFSPLLSLIHI